MRKVLLFSVLALLVGGCSEEVRRGGVGESCTAANDCQDKLSCLSLRCVALSEPSRDGGALPGSGASCSARSECATGLTCIDDVCRAMSVGTTDPSGRYSGRGESCRAKNDCAPGLACVSNTCRDTKTPLSHTKKSCYRVECATQADCCAAFVPNDKCETYRKNCETDPIFCNTYRTLCTCGRDCKEELCVTTPPGCVSNAECTSMQTPFCVASKCAECDRDEACVGDGERCVEGMCLAACTLDENCPAQHSCQDGKCTETGCTTDRECAFATRAPIAVCRNKKCQVPCAADSDCTPSESTGRPDANDDPRLQLQVCEAGECVFVGCESNNECRALLSIQSARGDARAVCK